MIQKAKVHEVAKDLSKQSKEIMNILKDFGVPAKTYASAIEDVQIDILLEYYTQSFEKHGNFDFSVFDMKREAPKPVKEEKKTSDVPKAPKTVVMRHVDMRQTMVELDKLDTEKIEELVPTHVKADDKKVQKIIKKPPQRPLPRQQHGRQNQQQHHQVLQQPRPEKKKEIIEASIQDEIVISDLAAKLKISPTVIIKKLFAIGIMATINQVIDYDTAALVAEDLGAIVTHEIVVSDEEKLFNDIEDQADQLKGRSPVVVVMGHVDHGKTSLLDAIRSTTVTMNEAGGITQHIGAYRVNIHDQEITFLDTPGHEAFTAMRARGAQVTDIAILVVAADDGIMPQTIEAINHAKAANVNIIVAINKIDKEGANADRVKQELTEYGMVCEEWGGDTICAPVSAKTGEGIDHLLEMILLVSEMKELRANPDRLAKGTVIEAKLDKGRGPVATVLVQNGTLHIGDIIVAGTSVGRVRAMMDDKGKRVKKAGPSYPVEIVGLSETPDGGDLFYAVQDEKMARDVVEKRKHKQKQEKFASHHKVSLEDLFDQIKLGEVKDLNLIIKADVQGSVEAVKQSLEKLSNEEVRVRAIHGGVGAITESDVMLAMASSAIIIGFNVRPTVGAAVTAEHEQVDVRLYRIIYNAIEEIESAMKGMLTPMYKEVVQGHAEVRAVFKVTGVGTIAGTYVTAGKIHRNDSVRVVRDGIVAHEGTLTSLKRFKDDAKEVAAGYECGIGVEKFNDIKEGDIIECFIMEEVKR
ncbi:MAG: translation initiation factor IF-2 [Hyphomonadaceae bacterium]|nr:translation initiation factor IF-2 [Clostridia bacterium]